MSKVSVRGIVKTSIVTAFTIAAALIWRDVFGETIDLFFPNDVLFYKFIGAIVATIFVVMAIYIILKTEEGAGGFMKSLMKRRNKNEK